MNNSANVLVKFTGDTKNLDGATSKASGALSKFKGIAKGVGTAVTVGVATAVTAATTTLVDLSKKSLKARADLEQNLGGVETLFKKNADLVVKNAKEAYKTAGVSANEYMQGVTSFAASLLQSTAGNTKKAAEISDMAFRDMSDNANKFGTDMAAIQNAYQGFAKQNYTMLDNLKLGYGGTKTEMERLLADAQKLTGVKYDIKNLSDVYSAIHAIQQNLGVTGTTAKEATETISGSLNMAKKAFENFLAGTASGKEVAKAVTIAAKNISKELVKIMPYLAEGLGELINGLIPLIPDLVQKLAPVLAKAVVTLVKSLVGILPTALRPIVVGITAIFAAFKVFSVIIGIINAVKTALVALKAIMVVVNAVMLANPIGLIIAAVVALIAIFVLLWKKCAAFRNFWIKLWEGIKSIFLSIVDWIKTNWKSILLFIINPFWGAFKYLYDHCEKFRNFVNKFVSTVVNFFKSIPNKIKSLPAAVANVFNNVKSKLSNVVERIKGTFKNLPSFFINIGKNMISGLWQGAKSMVSFAVDKFKSVGKSILKGLKGELGIHSPSTETAWMADMLGLGLTKELDKITPKIQEKMNSTFSVSPTLSNSANTHLSTQVNVINNINSHIDPLGQVVNKIKTFQSGAKNDYNYGKA